MFKSLLSLMLLVAFASAAPVPVSTSTYSLTYPDGWQQISIGAPSDTIVMMMNAVTGSSAITIGAPTDHPPTTDEMKAVMALYSGSGALSLSTSGSVVCGPNTFAMMDWKDTSAAGLKAGTHSRWYMLTQGNYIFEAVLTYNTLLGNSAVTGMETALATLRITAGTSIRETAKSRALGVGGIKISEGWHDALGRSEATFRRQNVISLFFRK